MCFHITAALQVLFGNQADRNSRFKAQKGQTFMPEPGQAVPEKAKVGRFVIPNHLDHQRPADEYKKSAAGSTKKLVQARL